MIGKYFLLLLLLAASACQRMEEMKVIASQGIKEGKLVLKNSGGELVQGRNDLYVEFQDSAGNLLQIDDADISAALPRPGMAPIAAPVSLSPTSTRGRFVGHPFFETNGEWRFVADYSGPAGKDHVTFTLNIR